MKVTTLLVSIFSIAAAFTLCLALTPVGCSAATVDQAIYTNVKVSNAPEAVMLVTAVRNQAAATLRVQTTFGACSGRKHGTYTIVVHDVPGASAVKVGDYVVTGPSAKGWALYVIPHGALGMYCGKNPSR